MFVRCAFLISIFVVSYVNCETRTAIARLVSQNVNGSIEFTETTAGLRVTGSIIGLPAGNYGFHVHELGDTTTCDASGSHFNPDGNTHGGRDHTVRHVGDLGNVLFVGTGVGVANVDFVDDVIALRGRNSILGRTLVLHEQEDDLGLGNSDNSLTTGNAGSRVACGVIGIKSPGEPWNSATTVSPSVLVFLLALSFVFRT
nr:uncharacterized protein LOC110372797 [Helicoverpa armigera]